MKMTKAKRERAAKCGGLTEAMPKHNGVHRYSKRAQQYTILIEACHFTIIDPAGKHIFYGSGMDADAAIYMIENYIGRLMRNRVFSHPANRLAMSAVSAR